MTLKNTGILIILLIFSVSCSEPTTIDADDTNEDSPRVEKLTRKKQRVLRYNCNGVVYSDKWETVNSLSKKFEIRTDNPNTAMGFRIKNLENNENGGGYSNSYGRFTIDLAPTVFNLKVEEGLNELQYYFEHCYEKVVDPVSNSVECAHTLEKTELETIWIKVEYRVVHLEGTKSIHPSREYCEDPSV